MIFGLSPVELVTYVSLALFLLYEIRDIWISLDDSRIKAVILDQAGKQKKYHVKKIKVKGGENFTVGGFTYRVDPDCVYNLGVWRVPTSYYNFENASPLNLRKNAKPSDDSSDYNAATKHHIVRGLLAAFDPPKISAEMTVVIIAVVVIGAVGYLWYDFGQRFDLLFATLETLQNTTN